MEESTHHTEEHNPDQPLKTDAPERPNFRYFPFFNRSQPVFLLVLVGFIMTCTSLNNEYALDDGIIIHQNSYVIKGIRGISNILTRDAYDSFYRRMHAKDQLQGGRYRPLPVITYAIEQELIGSYRTGYYMYVEDANHNGVLDNGPVLAGLRAKEPGNHVTFNELGKTPQSKEAIDELESEKAKDILKEEANYEFNNFIDLNDDNMAQPNECYNCWDLNRNFKNDFSEDLNKDGVFNEIDCQVYGAMLRHFNNIWMYILAGVFVYLLFSRYLLKNNPDAAFLAGLLFMIHPIHSEVVANIKGRDEILSVLFIALAFIFLFKYQAQKNYLTLLGGLVAFFLALMSKEYAILLYLLVPLALYMFTEEKLRLKELITPTLAFALIAGLLIVQDVRSSYMNISPANWFVGALILYAAIIALFSSGLFLKKETGAFIVGMYAVGLLYLVLRLNAVNMAPGVPDTEILNNPFLLANPSERFATKMVVLLKYLSLSVFPHPLISDYSYATYSYPQLSDPRTLISIPLHLLLLVAGIWLCAKRRPIGFAIMTYLLFILMVSNLIFESGFILHESSAFHSSIGICMALGWFFIAAFDRMAPRPEAPKRGILLALVAVLIVLSGFKNWERNWDWKNDVTLFLKDVKNAPNSVLVLGNAGARWIDLADTKEITGIHLPGQDSTSFNDYNGTLKIDEEEVKASGLKSKREVALMRGIGYLQHAVKLHPSYVNGYLNLGLAFFKLQKDMDAIFYWKMAERLYPDNPYLNNYYTVYSGILKERGMKAFERGDYNTTVTEYTRWTIILPRDVEAWYNLGGALFNLGRVQKARECWKKALELAPDRADIKKLLEPRP